MIYFMARGEDFVKIGFSDQPDKRRSQLQTGSPEELKILCTVPGCKKIEKELHNFFRPLKVVIGGKEWFTFSTGLRMYISRLQDLKRYEPPNQIERFCTVKK